MYKYILNIYYKEHVLYIYIYVHIYIYIYIYICTCTCIIYIYIYIYVHVHVLTWFSHQYLKCCQFDIKSVIEYTKSLSATQFLTTKLMYHTINKIYTCTCTCIFLCIYVDTSVCLEVSISNVIPESIDICPQLHLKQISQSSGITLLIHTPPDTHWTTCMCTLIFNLCVHAWIRSLTL